MLKSCRSSMYAICTANYLVTAQCVPRTERFICPKRHFTGVKNLLTERGKAEENVYFLKRQREQLMLMREKILNEKEVISGVLDKVQDEITRLRNETREQQNSELSGVKTSAEKTVDVYNQNSKF